MKRMKKLISVMLTLAMAMTLTVSVFASTTSGSTQANNKGKITINNAQAGKTYTIYRVLELESYDTAKDAYSYKVVPEWKSFFAKDEGATTKNGLDFVNIDNNGYVTWKDGTDAAEFAKLAINFATSNSTVTSQGTETAEENKLVEFDNLDLGYYVVDSNLGTLCSLGTTSGNSVDIEEKNEDAAIEKTVSEATASIGSVVHYEISINATDGAQNYKLHDKMSTGLTFNKDIAVNLQTKDGEKTAVKNSEGQNDKYTVTENLNDYTFEVTFTQAFCDKLTTGDVIIVNYSATVNKEALTVNELTNEATLTYGNNGEFSVSDNDGPTETKLYQFTVIKTDENNDQLAGAQFELYDAQTDGNKVLLVEDSVQTNGTKVYHVADASEKETEEFESATIEAGKAIVKGLGNGSYYLQETKAPDGYNKLSERTEVKIEGANNDNITIQNKKGSLLPSTGGIGTTIFYIIGGILVVGAAVLLVTKKRMGREA